MTAQTAPSTQLPPPPIAEQRPYSFERHGITVQDPYHWLKDQSYPIVDDADVLSYLRAENAYFEAAMRPHQPLIETLFQEMRGRIPEDDSSVPVRDGAFLYWWAFQPGAQYRTWYRRPASGGDQQLVFDEVAEAQGKQYFRLGAMAVSPDGRYAATLVDDDGAERFQLRIREIATGRDVETVTEVGIGEPVWTADSRGIVFTEVNDNWRSYRARLHRLGQPVPDPGPALHPDLDRRERLQRGPLRPGRQCRGAAQAGRAPAPQHPLFGRREPREIVDSDQ